MLSAKRLPGMAWLCLIMAVQSVSGFFGSGNGVRPGPLAQGGITWLYYKDLQKAAAWYEETLGLELVVDQGFARVYQTSPTAFVGLVDESQGMHRASTIKPVALAFVTDKVDEWYTWLSSQGVKMRSELANSSTIHIRGFTCYDCEGYTLEFQTFLPDPMNDRINGLIGAGGGARPSLTQAAGVKDEV